MKTVLITGTSRGLGKCLAEVFNKNNYNVIYHNGRLEGDLRFSSTVDRLKEIAEEQDIDILINNAGIYSNKMFSDVHSGEFREIIDTNLLGPIFLTKAIWPIFQRKKSGLVMFINSVAGKKGSPGELAYCASKFGLRGFADSLQYDGIKDGVRVVSVYIGAMRTDMTKDKGGDPKYNISPEEVSLMVLDLCKDYKGAEISEITIDKIGKQSYEY